MKIVAGFILLLLGSLVFLSLFFTATITDPVIEFSFVLEPGETYGPYEDGTYYHTRVLSKSALTGEVEVEGGSINLTANGYNTQHLKNVFVNKNYSFVINPADDQYTFTFDNRRSSVQSSIEFTLKETWTNTLSLILAFIILLISASTGIALVIVGFRKKTSRREELIKESER